ncbi:PCYCGC motif-containing (lipo)protein [Lysinibacillus sp. LZ02]|uniref:PCYCGC motif-containing (lipo)protein n=1 Tax=Lysinibacillus sp. LZ02 TaxID=3420668 RepID=UPI003D369349
MKKWSFLLAAALLLGACNNDEVKQQETDEQGHEQHDHVTGDIQEETKSADILPSFLDEQTDLMRATYQIAGQAPDILQWMPCYCGCGESAGHKSNLNCFVQEIKEDGSVVWDDHGTRCNVCVEIALSSAKMHQEGKSLKEIRQAIDEYYKEGYATPTPTEMPA